MALIDAVEQAPEHGGGEVRLQGSERLSGEFDAAPDGVAEGVGADQARDYTAGRLQLNQWSLVGNWTIGAEQATLNQPGGAITYRFRARDLHLVLGPGPGGRPVRFQVTVDGEAPGTDAGVAAQRLRQLRTSLALSQEQLPIRRAQ